MDATHMFSKIMKSNCNGGKDDEINQTQKDILRDVGRTIVHMVTLDGATIEGARGMIDVMIRALDVGRVSKLSWPISFQCRRSTSPRTSSPTRTYIVAKPAERLVPSAQSCGRNVETVLMTSCTLTCAHHVMSMEEWSRVGSGVNTLRLIRGRALEHLLHKVFLMFQGHRRHRRGGGPRPLCRPPQFGRMMCRPLQLCRMRRFLLLRRHQCRLPRQDFLAREPPHRSPPRQRQHQCRLPR